VTRPATSGTLATTALLTALLTVLLVAALLTPAVSHGHRLHAAMTTVSFNQRTARIEVNHRFYAHDAEQAVARILGGGADLISSNEDRHRFGVYVHSRFHLYDPAGDQLDLALRGVELDGDFLWVYESAPLPQPPLDGLTVEHGALRDIWKNQVNTVNVEGYTEVQTLTFSGSSKRLAVEFH
jgi:hypothetical protein